MTSNSDGFVPPPYPYDRLDVFKTVAAKHAGGIIDLSVGDPCDPPSAAVITALSTSNLERGYPPSIGIEPLRSAAHTWMQRRFDIDIPLSQIAACVGSKEFVVTTPQWMKLRTPSRDTVLFPAVSYPSYAMGAMLSGCRPVAVPMTESGGIDLTKISADDAKRALMIWMNSPSNPTGALEDMGAVVAWGRKHDVPVFSDECYVEFTWQGQVAYGSRIWNGRRRRVAFTFQTLKPRRFTCCVLRR
jgi:aspartate/methionine/tyrosine aminotransferase